MQSHQKTTRIASQQHTAAAVPMDHTEALPDDVLASILRRLTPRDIAASRGVRRAWLAVVDAHRLVLPHLFPHSVRGLCINYTDYETLHLFARPSAAHPAVDLSFLPHRRHGYYEFVGHCNGLLFCSGIRGLRVVNPATKRWEDIVWHGRRTANAHLVFDPATSPHYEVLSVPQYLPHKVEQDDRRDLVDEWPTSLWTLDVFSSRTQEWQTKSFVREGDAAGTRASALRDPLWADGGPRLRHSTYWQGSLYVQCRGAFVARFSLSRYKYQVIKSPIDAEKTEHVQYLGKSEKGVYLATIQDSYRLQVWTLTESSGQIDWVLKHHIDLEPVAMAWFRGLQLFDKTWTIADDKYHRIYYYDDDDDDDYDDNDDDDDDDADDDDGAWNSDDDNVLNIEDCDTCYGVITFLGFHPYKEVVFLGLTSLVGVAYHLKSSKIQYIGNMLPKDCETAPTNGIHEAFPYTPCMIGELLNS